MTKHPGLLRAVEFLRDRFGPDLAVVDHWEGDLLAIGITRKAVAQKLAYLSLYPGSRNSRFYVALENPAKTGSDGSYPYEHAGSHDHLSLSEAADVIGKHLGMTEIPQDMIARICHLPSEFHARENVSEIQLVTESGYREAPESLTMAAVSTYLSHHPDLIDAWIMHSGDKRTSSGWYIEPRSDNTFEVGYFPEGERIVIAGRADACAEFIVREIQEIAAFKGRRR